MTNPAAGIITALLPTLITSFRTTGLRQELADQVTEHATVCADAILKALTDAGYEILNPDQATQLHAAAAAAEPRRHRIINTKCARCGTHMMRLLVRDFDTENPTINGPDVITAMTAMSPHCSQAHRTNGTVNA